MLRLSPITLVAFRPKTQAEKLLSLLALSEYIHIGLLTRRKGSSSLWIYHASKEMGQVLLEPLDYFLDCLKYSCDFYQLKPEIETKLDISEAVKAAEHYLGKPYGWSTVKWLALAYFPIIGKKIKYAWPDNDPKCPHCAALVSNILRKGGVDPCPDYSDVMTTPDDLCYSPVFRLVRF